MNPRFRDRISPRVGKYHQGHDKCSMHRVRRVWVCQKFVSSDDTFQDLPIAQPDSDSFSDEDDELSEESDGDFYNSPPPAAASPAPTEYFEWGSSPVRPPAESRIKPTTNPPVNPLAKDDDEDFLLDWEEEIVNENEQATNAVPLAQPFVPPVSTPFTFGFTVTTTGSSEQIPPTDTSNDSKIDMSAALRNATENLPSFLDTSISVDQPSTAPTKTSETKQQSQDSNETVTTIEITPSNQVSLSAEIPAAQRSSKVLNEDGEEESSSESEPESEREVRYLTDASSQPSELGESSSEESETGDDEQEPPARQVKKEPSPQKTRISAPSKVVSKHTDIPVSEAPQSLSGLASGEPSTGPAKEPKTVQQTEDITGSRNVNNDASTRPIDLPPTDTTTPLPPDETRSISKKPTAAKVKHLTSIKHDDSSTKASLLGKRRASEDTDDQGPIPASKRVKPSFNDDPNTKKGLTGAEQGGVVNPTTRPTTVKRTVTEAAMRTHSRGGASIAGPAAPKPDSVAVPRYRAIGHSNGSRPQWGAEVRDGSSMRKLFDLFMEKEVRPKTNGPRRPASENTAK
ncbi:hypothetical protein CPB86DRAFT_293392 [Serendipita vermifera]|nr:hypothetical protein CPB86DRAFT_293392 [Serendipita vermifera]